jgi:hypothetical protein
LRALALGAARATKEKPMNKMLSDQTFDIPAMTYLADAGRKSVGALAACNLWNWYESFTSLETLSNGQKPGELGWGGDDAPKGIFAPWPKAKVVQGRFGRNKNPCFYIPLTGPSGEDLLLVIHGDNTCVLGKRIGQDGFRDGDAARRDGQLAYMFLPLILKLKAPGRSRPDLATLKAITSRKSRDTLYLRTAAQTEEKDWFKTACFAPYNLDDKTAPIVAALSRDVEQLIGLFNTCPPIAHPEGRFTVEGQTEWPAFLPHLRLDDTSKQVMADRAQDLAAWLTMVSGHEQRHAIVTLETPKPFSGDKINIGGQLILNPKPLDIEHLKTDTIESICGDVLPILSQGIAEIEIAGIAISSSPHGRMITGGATICRISGCAADLSAHEKLRLVARYGDPLHARAALSALRK